VKYLIVGLGNIGDEYLETRHNIGFKVLDALVNNPKEDFKIEKHGDVAKIKFKGRILVLLKPSTYVNLSGKAVNYWLQKEKIHPNKLLVVVDDIALPFGTLRIRGKGSNGGHNGLKSIDETLGGNTYARLRFGVGNEFSKGKQVDYVLGEWDDEQKTALQERIKQAGKTIQSFSVIGADKTMSMFNNK
jgi:PTH1 family peptidyl-tRNA hydrolase